MRRMLPLAIVLALGAGALGYVMSSRAPQQDRTVEGPIYKGDGKVEISRPTVKDEEPQLEPETTTIEKTGDPVKQTVEKLVETSGDKDGRSAIPKGTKLISVKVAEGVATLDFSKEFAEVSNTGDTGESFAQNALRKALAQFPRIEKMTVMVDGKPFESEHAGAWSDIPVRDASTRAGGDL